MNARPLKSSLIRAAAELIKCQSLVTTPENREKLIQAELQVKLVLLSECPEPLPRKPGHHGG